MMNACNLQTLVQWIDGNCMAGAKDQLISVRSQVARLFAGLEEYLEPGNGEQEDWHDRWNRIVRVTGTHVSKSVTLPVYYITVSGTEIIFRGNFHDWKVSISAPVPVRADFLNLFNPGEIISPCHCEGFPADRVHGSHDQDQQQFTVNIMDDYRLFTFFWILAAYLKRVQVAGSGCCMSSVT